MDDSLTRELLEYVAQEEPWHIVCAVFHHRFPSPEVFVQALFELRERELLSIEPGRGIDVQPTPDALLREARAHDFYEDVDWPSGPVWKLLATDAGVHVAREHD